MNNPWFRFYSAALNNPKVQCLSGDQFKAWVNILCVTSQCDGKETSRDDLSFYLRMSQQQCDEIIDQLIDKGLLVEADGILPYGWNERQYKSDTSAERTRKYRENKRKNAKNSGTKGPGQENGISANGDDSCDVTVTPPDTDTDTDTDTDNNKAAPLPPPIRPGLSRPMSINWMPTDETMGQLAQHNIPQEFIIDLVPEFVLYWRERGTPALTWGNKFLKHAISKWREFQSAPPATPKQRLPMNWRPGQKALDALLGMGIATEFIESLIPEFVIFWHESNRAHHSWNAKFINHAQLKWSHRHVEAAEKTRDLSLRYQLTDRSWAAGEQPMDSGLKALA